MSYLRARFEKIPRELLFFAAATLVMGLAGSMVDSVLNNFLNERFALSGFQRSFLELPRELPGFLVIFVTALLGFLCNRRLGGVAMVLATAGILLIGFASTTYTLMVLCLFVYSLGQHIFLPITSGIGMELAEEGKTGQRLGQLNALRNLAVIIGSFIIFLGFRFLHFSFQLTFILAAVGFALGAALMFSMRPKPSRGRQAYLVLHKEYNLYYALTVLFGMRKQLFITFAPWVIVTVFEQPTQTLATLLTIGGVIGILFQPLLGWMVDHLGERTVLAGEAVMLVLVCAGYGFAKDWLPLNSAFLVICVCYLLDQMLMSVGMARATYLKKIARHPDEIQATLSTGVSIDHIFSISIALLGGTIWNLFGYQFVFLVGAVIAVINFFVAMRIRIPAVQPAVPAVAESIS